jgi:hypothetical protein
MAKAVAFREFTPRNSRDDLMRKVDQAPVEHAEAVLAAYDLLQRLHEKGLIDLLSGLLSAGDTVVDRIVDVISSKEMVTAFASCSSSASCLAQSMRISSAPWFPGHATNRLPCSRLANKQSQKTCAAAWPLLSVF